MDIQIAGLVAAGMALSFVLQFLQVWSVSSRLDKMERMLDELHSMHNSFDEDGRPKWFFPRGMLEHQKDLIQKCREISYVQRDIIRLLNDILDKIK